MQSNYERFSTRGRYLEFYLREPIRHGTYLFIRHVRGDLGHDLVFALAQTICLELRIDIYVHFARKIRGVKQNRNTIGAVALHTGLGRITGCFHLQAAEGKGFRQGHRRDVFRGAGR